jgi:NAD+ synthase (glutamine-hydrolysing)
MVRLDSAPVNSFASSDAALFPVARAENPRDSAAMSFRSLYRHGFARVAACTTRTAIADPQANAATILRMVRDCDSRSVALAVFPELCVSGYAIGDLFQQRVLLDAVETAIGTIVRASADLMPLVLIGAPLRHRGALYNCALAIHRGKLLGVVPKIHLPNYREFYEPRHFVSGDGEEGGTIAVAGLRVPFGTDLLFAAEDLLGFVVHAEICEDVWVPAPPSSEAALAGATILANLSASNITIGKAETRKLLCRSQSARCLAAYLYAAAGAGESTTDLAWDGQASVFENGATLVETERFPTEDRAAIADIDLDLLRQERLQMGSFDTNRRRNARDYRTIGFTLAPPTRDIGFLRTFERFPFVPADVARLEQDCYEAYNIQVSGLMQRMQATKLKKVVIGISGGLDSTQALIVCAQAFDRLGLPRANILAYTMPGFATSDYTKGNAWDLMKALGVTGAELDIKPAAIQMLGDIGHPYADGANQYDITFENVQAGLRTDYLFRLANHNGAIVIGTGDLSELALGWCTYGVGDQMAHYNVNAGVPKTLIQHLIRWIIGTERFPDTVCATLDAIVSTEISPELIPAAAGEIPQSTEAKIGPYALQDFTLFYILRYGFPPSKIAFMALHTWEDEERGAWPPHFPPERRNEYDLPTIRHWMKIFLQRFFAFSQFKRSAMPNGPKVTAGGSLSPRGDWRAPSDGNAAVWLAELERNVPKQL